MDEQTTHQAYEPPLLVEVGQFSEDTLGDSGILIEPLSSFGNEFG